MPTILLATGNERKLLEARLACDDFGITVEQVILEIDEIQNHDPIKVTIHKVNEAYNQVLRPVTITDTSWDIPAYHGFPGAYMKDVAEWFNPKDFISIMKAKNDNRISFTESIAFRDKDKVKVFSQEYRGIVADKPGGRAIFSIRLLNLAVTPWQKVTTKEKQAMILKTTSGINLLSGMQKTTNNYANGSYLKLAFQLFKTVLKSHD